MFPPCGGGNGVAERSAGAPKATTPKGYMYGYTEHLSFPLLFIV